MKKYNIKTTDVELLKKWYYLMTLGRALDEKAPAYLLQSLGWSFHAPYAGHDGIQLAIGQVFTKGEDFLFPYYRDMLTALSAGMTAEELILNGISKATDPGSGGRHMSNHFAKPEWHIENISSATGTHDLHAAGVARAMVYYDHKGVVITSHGESASSEGFVYEAVNGASLERLPVIFVWQDNGYGISVPKKDQTAARKVADNFSGFKNLKIIHCNGKDVFDSMNAMTEAREYALLNRNPVIVHANCVRIGSHSNSDKDTLYRDENELAYVKEADPLLKFRRMLLRYKRLTEEELKEIEEKAKKDLEFTEKVLKESRSAYYKAQQAYAAFEDGNKNIISASYRTEQERLRNEMTLTFNVYNTLAQKLEQDKLRVQEQTPVYTIIEPATVPLKASSPKKLLILVAFIFLAFIGGCGYLIIQKYEITSSPGSEA